MELKMNYNENDLNENTEYIKENLESNALIKEKLIELITKMVNPFPDKRYQKIDDVITQIELITKMVNPGNI